MKKSAVVNPKLRLSDAVTFQIMWCFLQELRVVGSPIKTNAT